MKNKFLRLLRGQFPDQHETWREYMDRDMPLAMIALCMLAVVLLMLVLAEAVDRGLQ